METKEKQLQIVNFEQAQRLKAAGFNWEVEYYYNDHHELYEWNKNSNSKDTPNNFPHYDGVADCYSAPTVALALKWFRDEKNIDYSINNIYYYDHKKYMYYGYYKHGSTVNAETYDEAESELLDKLLTLIETQS